MAVDEFQRELRDLLVEGVDETGKELGRGSYGVVIELKVNGLLCAGKKLHQEFFAFASPQEKRSIETRFVEECQQLSRLRHPNIVQLLGVCFDRAPSTSRVPTLVMEFLPMTLAQCLERYENIPDYLKYSVLKDAGVGLLHLHQQRPAIIHRDLTANNILLTSNMQGKIADLGVARIVNLNPAQVSARMTMCPGTPAYMPPEALSNRPTYDTSLDCFSFGNLIVHTVVQKWPLPLPLLQADPSNPGLLKPLMEIERRAEFLEEMGPHPLRRLAEQCLHNDPRRRPTAAAIVQELERVSAAHPPPFANVIEMQQALRQNTTTAATAATKDMDPALTIMALNTRVSWSPLPDLPQGAVIGNAVFFDGKVYYAAAVTNSRWNAFVFDFTGNQQWTTLPSIPHTSFTFAVYQGQLVLVGGWDTTVNAITNQVLVWSSTRTWTCSLPGMPTPRSKSAALGYNQYLVVAGGWNGFHRLDTVEVLDGGNREWFKGAPLPIAGFSFKTAYYKGHWYLVGGDSFSLHRSVRYTSIQTLIANAQGSQHQSSKVWSSLADLSCGCSPLAIWGGTLVALGGVVSTLVRSSDREACYKTQSRVSKIHAYCPHTKSWYQMGDIPIQGSAHSVLTLPTGELLVVGGRTEKEHYGKTVFKASLVPTNA